MSSMHLLYCYMYEKRMMEKTYLSTNFRIMNDAHHFLNKSCRVVVVLMLRVFYASTCTAQGQLSCKLTNLLLPRIFGISS